MLEQLIGAIYAKFVNIVKEMSHVLGNENWKDNFDALLHIVRGYNRM